MSSTIHIFSIEEQMFEVRQEMKITKDKNEEHSFVVYKNDLPYRGRKFIHKLNINLANEINSSFRPDSLYTIPTKLENEVRRFLVR